MKRLLILLTLMVSVLTACGGTTTVAPNDASQSAPAARASATAGPSKTQVGTSGLPTVALSDLPPEAQQTYELVMQGGPYPYSQDDQVFGNREGNLPQEEYGWYREYTIPTPGSRDRGAQRFVVGDDDVFFYTDDHYNSFSEVIE